MKDIGAQATKVCPACHAGRLSPGPKVAVDELAAVWAREWPMTRPTGAQIADMIERDVGTNAVGFLRCGECGLESADPMKSWTSAHYPSQSHGLGFDHERALAHLATFERSTVLEIGCGCGEFLVAAARLGHYGLGIDFSQESVSKARAAGVDARVADLSKLANLSGRPESFDVVSLFQVIEHLEDPDELFVQVRGLCRPGSRLYVGCPSPRRFTRYVRHRQRVGESEFWDYPPQHLLRWTPESLTAFLGRHHWKVDAVELEPFHLRGAAAQLVAIDGVTDGWYCNSWRRRAETFWRRMTLAIPQMLGQYSGTRLFLRATLQSV